MSGDVSFDGIANEFESDIYGSTKGAVRLAVLWSVLNDDVPALADQPMRILDARRRIRAPGGTAGRTGAIQWSCATSPRRCSPRQLREPQRPGSPMQSTSAICRFRGTRASLTERFDLVMCHAVLEWLDDPKSAVRDLALLVKRGGHLSLMFYNRFASLLKRTLAGDFGAALADYRTGPSRRGWGEGATALDNEVMVSWLEDQDLEVEARAGIRIFHDHVVDKLRGPQRLAQLIELEKAVCRSEPFASLGQHTHLTCRRVGLPA